MLSNVMAAKDILRALLSSYLTRYIKNIYSVATTPSQFRNGMYNFVTELSHLLCNVFANYTFWHKKNELSLTIDIGLLHMYHLSVLTPKQHNIPLIISRQISIANVSPNLTDAHLIYTEMQLKCVLIRVLLPSLSLSRNTSPVSQRP